MSASLLFALRASELVGWYCVGNIPVTIRGFNFGTLATFTIRGVACPVLVTVPQSHTQFQCTLPAGQGPDGAA